MSPKSIAFLVVGMVLISSVFIVFHVSYPSNPATIKLNQPPPKNIKPPNVKIFQNQSLNLPKLGINQTTFTPSGNTSVIMEGYVYNGSSQGSPIVNQQLGIAVMQAFTMVTTNSSGFYQVHLLAAGQGTFAFKAFQYATKYYDIYIGQGMTALWQNVTLQPQTKYDITGFTQSHGNDIQNVGLEFRSFWGTYASQSGSNSYYSLLMVNDTYTILASKQGFSPVPYPANVTVSGPNTLNVELFPDNQTAYYMNGYVFNELSNPISGANVSVTPITSANEWNYSSSDGFYNISVPYYLNQVEAQAIGYSTQTNTVMVTKNITNYNFTLYSENPFYPSINTNLATGGYPAGMPDSTSSVNYHYQGFPLATFIVTGQVILKQTGMPVPGKSFTVYTSVNGTYFYDYITTNQSGYYTITLAFPGSYKFNITSTEFFETSMNASISGSRTYANINVSTSPSNIFTLSGSVYNSADGQPLSNSTVFISSQNGGILGIERVNSTGYYSFTALNGYYTITATEPGFVTNSTYLDLNQNLTGKNILLTPSPNIGSGSSQWNPGSGSGLPGVNGSGITSNMNSTQANNSSPTTSSNQPVNLTIRMIDNSTSQPINYTAFALYIKVNGIYLRETGSTNGTGEAVINLAYGGTYILLPEMIQYNGQSRFINTSTVTGVIDFNMTKLSLYSLKLNLSNPLGVYTGSTVPVSGLSGDGYYLPLNYSSVKSGSNYTNVTYLLPDGNYTFSYNDVNYVPTSFIQTISKANVTRDVKLDPYALILTWSSTTNWYYTLIGPYNSQNYVKMNSGNQVTILGLASGSYDFYTYIGGTLAGAKTFTLSTNSYQENLTFTVVGNYLEMSNFNYTVKTVGSLHNLVINYSLTSDAVWYLASFNLSVPGFNNISLYLDNVSANGVGMNGYFNLSNYFATSSTTITQIRIDAYGLTAQQLGVLENNLNGLGANLTVLYYVVNLGVTP